MLDCGRGLNCSSAIADLGYFLVVPYVYLWSFVAVGVNQGIN